jgi:cell division protein FtsL
MKLERNLILLIAIIGISFKSFSQTATEPSTVFLTEPVAKLVVKDLVSYDGLLAESKAVREQLTALNSKIVTLEEVIKNLKLQLDNRNSVISQKDLQIVEYQNMSEDLKKEVKRLSRIGKIYKIGSAIGAAAILLNILGK